MRKIAILLIIAFVQGGVISAQKNCNIRVASFNLRYDTKGDGDNSWEHRKDMVTGLIQFHDFDVFGIQEGLIHQVKALKESGTYTSVGVGRDDGKEGGEHVSVFYKENKFKLIDSGNFWFSETPATPSLGWDAQCKRVCSWAKLRDLKSKKTFYFFSVHFDHMGNVARLKSADVLLANIKKIAGSFPVFCVGDFNGSPSSKHMQIIQSSGVLIDSRGISKNPPYGSEGTTSQFNVNAEMKVRIDYIFVTKEIRINKYGTLNDFQYGRFPSDHFPIMVDAVF